LWKILIFFVVFCAFLFETLSLNFDFQNQNFYGIAIFIVMQAEMILKFLTNRHHQGLYIKDKKKIFFLYLKNEFLLDFLLQASLILHEIDTF
jgi:membrane-bound metal-dependent hydrolase YbcI (DUF457 family)